MAARQLRVLVTIMYGEHRIHLRGDAQDVIAVSQLSRGFFEQAGTGAGGKDTVVSGPESRVKDLWIAWSSVNSDLVSQAFSQLKREARKEHLSQHPECAAHWPTPIS